MSHHLERTRSNVALHAQTQNTLCLSGQNGGTLEATLMIDSIGFVDVYNAYSMLLWFEIVEGRAAEREI